MRQPTLHCPHCGQPGISVLQKLCLGPAVPTRCQVCRQNVGVPVTALLAVLPFIAAIISAALTSRLSLKVLLWLLGAGVMVIIHGYWIPLERR